MENQIIIKGACEHNLKNVDVVIPHNKLTVVTGVSGSGKSSLVFDTLYREGQRRFLESLSAYSRHLIGKTFKPEAESFEGILPTIAVKQGSMIRSPKSTVGTISGLYDYLRLLFARIGKPIEDIDIKVNRALFSFNSPYGYCPECKGTGLTDQIAVHLIVGDERKSLREAALNLTTPNGYIIYSQVTMDSLDMVCRAHGFNVDIPWKDLKEEEKHIVLYGSDKVIVPYGKHTLESRMKWTGITAKPREEGYYKGIIPVMEDILKRDRNDNILRFAETLCCEKCKGTKLREEALKVKIKAYDIACLCNMPVEEMWDVIEHFDLAGSDKMIAGPVLSEIGRLVGLFRKLNLGYLSLSRESVSLSGGEMQRLKLLGLMGSGISGVLYVFDEPGAGLHPSDNENLIGVLDDLIKEGNTVVVVGHDEGTFCNADYIIDVGPGAGVQGGRILFQGKPDDFMASDVHSLTKDYLSGNKYFEALNPDKKQFGSIVFKGITKNNLKNIDVEIKLNKLNIVSGVSGAGKTSLVKGVIYENLKSLCASKKGDLKYVKEVTGFENIPKVIEVDRSPIGRTPRSNPATYTGLSDKIRDLFANLEESKKRQWKKGRFSFNTPGGRCEDCMGAGVKTTGMHFLGNINTLCETCGGRRFNDETLEVKYKGKDIAGIYDMSVNDAVSFFEDEKEIKRHLVVLQELGLGYLALGQPSNTLSGGEAQRLKLAEELVKQTRQAVLYIFDEPTVGLHFHDIAKLLKVFEKILNQGHSILLIEHNPRLILLADHIIDLGPGSGNKGGSLVYMGEAAGLKECRESVTGRFIHSITKSFRKTPSEQKDLEIRIEGASAHNLKNVNLSLPKNKIITFCGVSGSGKSSLAYDTIFSEASRRFNLNLSAYLRSYLPKDPPGEFISMKGLSPAIGIDKARPEKNPRSIVASYTGLYDYIRLLFTRFGTDEKGNAVRGNSMSDLSFNHEAGACRSCKGLGKNIVCDPEKLITNPSLALISGAMNGSKTGRFYGDAYGQYIACLIEVGAQKGIDYSVPYLNLSEGAKALALYGCGEELFDINWKFKRKNREGVHKFKGKWPGFVNLVNDEYLRKHQDGRGQAMLPLMKEEVCPDCNGNRIRIENQNIYYNGVDIPSLLKMDVVSFDDFIKGINDDPTKVICSSLAQKASAIIKLGLGYISLDREVSTLSTGEWQRLKLATHIYEGLTGITYILDEPSSGLHQKDVSNLMEVVKLLKHQGNTVIIVEHNPQVILDSDYLVEMGPGAGERGGEIVFSGLADEIKSSGNSVIKEYLDRQWISKPQGNNIHQPFISIQSANANNLKNINVDFFRGKLNVISGVSGSGKSSLLYEVVYQSLVTGKAENCSSFSVVGALPVVIISDERIPESRRITPISYTSVDDLIYKEFATNNDQDKKIIPGSLSPNSKEGQCMACKGYGRIKISMDFVSDVWVECDLCKGKGYNDNILSYSYRGKNIHEAGGLSFEQASLFFSHNKKLSEKLGMFCELGLGYLKLNQDFASLSGGELQRLKLIKEMLDFKQPCILLMDEPCLGLHFKDVEKLLMLIDKLLAMGFTIIAIEHSLQFISHADYVVELGPEGGNKGGYVVCGR